MRRKLISLFLLSLLTGCDAPQTPPSTFEMPAIPVKAGAPDVKDITIYIEAIGTLQASVQAEVRPEVHGSLQAVLVQEGQWVKQGTPLFEINSLPYVAKVKEAEAQLFMDRAALRSYEKKWQRYEQLAEKDFMPQAEWDDLEASVQRGRGLIQLDEARLDLAKIDLNHCTIRSPIDGRVGKLDAHSGQLVAVGQALPLAQISNMDPLFVEFFVAEKEFPRIQKDKIKIELSSLSHQHPMQKAEVTFLDNQFDTTSGLLLMRGKIENHDYNLRPGQSVKVRIPVQESPQALLIPQKAIRYAQQGPYVYVIKENSTVEMRNLKLGNEVGMDQIVLEGLSAGERIVHEGHLRLSPGFKVEVK